MNKILILLLSLLISFNSYGKWKAVTVAEDGIVHVDFDGIKTNKNIFYWQMIDLFEPNPKQQALSVQYFYELNCTEPRRQRMLSISAYSESMGHGAALFSSQVTDDWGYFRPNSISKEVATEVCDYVYQ
jgi:hypothetical protein